MSLIAGFFHSDMLLCFQVVGGTLEIGKNMSMILDSIYYQREKGVYIIGHGPNTNIRKARNGEKGSSFVNRKLTNILAKKVGWNQQKKVKKEVYTFKWIKEVGKC
jgi:hypothetical protein